MVAQLFSQKERDFYTLKSETDRQLLSRKLHQNCSSGLLSDDMQRCGTINTLNNMSSHIPVFSSFEIAPIHSLLCQTNK